MPVKNYYTLNGEIIGERTVGGARTDYLTDALGSITATVDQNAQVVNTYRYKPYGTQLANTGAGPDPRFKWVGSLGYRKTSRQFSDAFVRARHYSEVTGRWTTADPLWAGQRSYEYAECDPIGMSDSSGLQRGSASPPPVRAPSSPSRAPSGQPQPAPGTTEAPPIAGEPLGIGIALVGIASLIKEIIEAVSGKPKPKPPPIPKNLPNVICTPGTSFKDALCSQIRAAIMRECPGGTKAGAARACQDPGSRKKVTKEMCDAWKRNEDLWRRCAELRKAELDWGCFDQRLGEDLADHFKRILGHHEAATGALNAAIHCRKLIDEYCKNMR